VTDEKERKELISNNPLLSINAAAYYPMMATVAKNKDKRSLLHRSEVAGLIAFQQQGETKKWRWA
jgi:hypothetical protein